MRIGRSVFEKIALLSLASAFTLGAISLYQIHPPFAYADDEDDEIDELNDKIAEQKERLEQLDSEILEQQRKVNEITTQKKSLETEVRTLDTSRATIEKSIKRTETSIETSVLTIEKLAIEMDKKQREIDLDTRAIAEGIRMLDRLNNSSLIEVYLNDGTLSEALAAIDQIDRVQTTLRDRSAMLAQAKIDLEERMHLTAAEKDELEQRTKQLSGERQAVLATKQQKDVLLTQTKSTESEYQRILNEKVAAKAAFERELQNYESQLNIIINRNAFPTEGTTALNWPLANIIVTQQFGSSEFAAKNPSVYGGRAYHPGTDFGAPIGTALMAPLSGTVTHTGNTDAIPGCYSWGKWILLKHDNGLTSLFAHLSVISVSPGEKVSTGDILGNTGNTGYSTGPHLHYTLYASEGVRVVPFSDVRSSTSCGGTVTPTAPPDAYLDPMDYLPK